MMQPQEIARLLEQGLTDAEVNVDGDGRHFQAVIVSPDFEGLSRIKQHRLVYEILGEHIDADVLHAISMRTLTPAQRGSEGA